MHPVPRARPWGSSGLFGPLLYNAGPNRGELLALRVASSSRTARREDSAPVHAVIGQAAPPALARGTVGREGEGEMECYLISSWVASRNLAGWGLGGG